MKLKSVLLIGVCSAIISTGCKPRNYNASGAATMSDSTEANSITKIQELCKRIEKSPEYAEARSNVYRLFWDGVGKDLCLGTTNYPGELGTDKTLALRYLNSIDAGVKTGGSEASLLMEMLAVLGYSGSLYYKLSSPNEGQIEIKGKNTKDKDQSSGNLIMQDAETSNVIEMLTSALGDLKLLVKTQENGKEISPFAYDGDMLYRYQKSSYGIDYTKMQGKSIVIDRWISTSCVFEVPFGDRKRAGDAIDIPTLKYKVSENSRCAKTYFKEYGNIEVNFKESFRGGNPPSESPSVWMFIKPLPVGASKSTAIYDLSAKRFEAEVLYSPNVKFKVVGAKLVNDDMYGDNKVMAVYLEELP